MPPSSGSKMWQQFSSKCLYPSTVLHSVTTLKTMIELFVMVHLNWMFSNVCAIEM